MRADLDLYLLWLTRYLEDIGTSTSMGNKDPAGLVDPDDNQWAVEALQGRRKFGRGFQYFVKWVGYPESENTWEKKKDISPALVEAYDSRHLLE